MKTENNKCSKYNQPAENNYIFYEMVFFLLLILIACNFIYIQQAYPLKAILFSGGYFIIALILVYHTIKTQRLNISGNIAGVFFFFLFLVWVIIKTFTSPVPALGYEFLATVTEGFWVFLAAFILNKHKISAIQKVAGVFSEDKSIKNKPSLSSANSEILSKNVSIRLFLISVILAVVVLMCFHAVYQRYYGFSKQYKILEEAKYFEDKNTLTSGIEFALKEKRVFSTFGNSNQFACLLGVCVPLILSLYFFFNKNKKALFIVLCLLLIFLWSAALTKSRGGLLSFIFAAAIYLILVKSYRKIDIHKTIAFFFITVIIIMLVFFFNLKKILPEEIKAKTSVTFLSDDNQSEKYIEVEHRGFFQRLFSGATIRERFYYLYAAEKIISEAPFTGSGTGSYGLLYSKHKHLLSRESKFVHNTFFQIWAELGIAGIILFALWTAKVLSCISKSICPPDNGENYLRLALTASFITFLLNGLFEYSFYFRELFLLMCLFTGIAAGCTAATDKENPKRRSLNEKMFVVVIIALLCSSGLFLKIIYKPSMASFFSYYGDIFLKEENNPELAMEYYNKAILWNPDMPWEWSKRAHLYLANGNLPQAEEDINKAIELNPYSASLCSEKAMIYIKSGNYAKAHEAIDLAIKNYPSNARYYFEKAQMYDAEGKYKSAITEIEKAIERSIEENNTIDYIKYLGLLKNKEKNGK